MKYKIGIVTIGWLLGVLFSPAVVHAQTFSDNFDSYSEGNIRNQGDWIGLESAGSDSGGCVSSTQYTSSPYGLRVCGGNKRVGIIFDDTFEAIQLEFDFFIQSGGGTNFVTGYEILSFGNSTGDAGTYTKVFDGMQKERNGSLRSPSTQNMSVSDGWHTGVLNVTETSTDEWLWEFLIDGTDYYSATRTSSVQPNAFGYSGVNAIYAEFYIDNLVAYVDGDIPVDNSNFNTRIEWVEPGATTSSQMVDYEFNYYLNSNTHSTSTYTKILLQLCPLSYDVDCTDYTVEDPVIWDSYQTVTYSASSTYLGYHLGLVNFWNGVDQDVTCSWWEFWCEEQTVEIGVGTSYKFNIATTTIPAIISVDREVALSTCEDSNWAGESICKTLIWLFYPSAETVDRFVTLSDQFNNKAPFGYALLLEEKVTNMTATSTAWSTYTLDLDRATSSSYDLGSIQVFNWQHAKDTIGTENLDTITDWIVNILWIIFIVVMVGIVYKIISNV